MERPSRWRPGRGETKWVFYLRKSLSRRGPIRFQSLEERSRRVVRRDRRPASGRGRPGAARTCTAGAAASTTGSRSGGGGAAGAGRWDARTADAQGDEPARAGRRTRGVLPAAPGPRRADRGYRRHLRRAPTGGGRRPKRSPRRSGESPPTYGWLALGAVAGRPAPAVALPRGGRGPRLRGPRHPRGQAREAKGGRRTRTGRLLDRARWARRRSDHRRRELRHRSGAAGTRRSPPPDARYFDERAYLALLEDAAANGASNPQAGWSGSPRWTTSSASDPGFPSPGANSTRTSRGPRPRAVSGPRPYRGGGAGARPRARPPSR